jgi:FixJ family two-component response regulator
VVSDSTSVRERYATLTPRQRDVFGLVVSGKTTKEISSELGISERTVKAHRSALFEKMRARSVVELVNMAHAIGVNQF